jgi:hypothetical protein
MAAKKTALTKKAPAKMGRPTKRNDGVIKAILDGLGNGTPLTVICREQGITDTLVRAWAEKDAALSYGIAAARKLGFDVIATDALRIADDRENDTFTDADGNQTCNKEWIARSKLRVETRLKLLAKWDPKRYGDKPEIIVNNNNTAAGNVNLGQQQEDQLAQLVAMARASAKKQVIDV